MRRSIRALLAATMALSLMAVGLTYGSGPDDKAKPASKVCPHQAKGGQCQMLGGGKCNPETCKGKCDPANCQGKCDPENCKGNCGQACCKGGKAHASGHCQIEGAEYTVTNSDNGVVIKITSEDPAVVELIQACFAKFPQRSGLKCGAASGGKGNPEGCCKKGAALP